MAERRVDVARLNDLARQRYASAGRLGADRLDVEGYDFAVGDRVMFAKNDYRLGVRNGERGLVVGLDHDDRTVTVEVDDHDTDVFVPCGYLEAGSLEWGYAATVHKNQGATSDYSYLLASDRLFRELGYSALSRGRVENRVWTVTDIEHDIDHEESHGAEPDTERNPISELLKAMERSAAQQMAIDEATDLPDPIPLDTDIDVGELIDRRDSIDTALYRSAPVRVADELDEATRRVAVAERRLAEADEHQWAARTDSVAEARAQLDQYAAMQARFDDWTRDHRSDLRDRRLLDAQITHALTEQVVAVEHDPPAELVATIGHPPVGVDARTEWRAAAVGIAIDALRGAPRTDAEMRPTAEHEEMDLT